MKRACTGKNARGTGPCQSSASQGFPDCARCGGRRKSRAAKVAKRAPTNSLGEPWIEGQTWTCLGCGATGPDRDDVRMPESCECAVGMRYAPPEHNAAIAEKHNARYPAPPASTLDERGRARWNPRWLHFCDEHGLEPDCNKVAREREERGEEVPMPAAGINAAFMSWCRERWAEWGATQTPKVGWLDTKFDDQHVAFDAWLDARAESVRGTGPVLETEEWRTRRALSLAVVGPDDATLGAAFIDEVTAFQASIASAHDHEADSRPSEVPVVHRDVKPENVDLFGNVVREYACLSMDPPWAERGGGKIKRGADRHYDLAGKLGDIRPIVRAIRDSGSFTPAPNAHLWCWYTDTFLEDALALVRELGFRYVRTFVWVKTADDASEPDDDDLRMGIGQYGRGCHEGMIFAVRGKGQDPSVWTGDRAVRSVFHAPHPTDESGKRIHSRKPPKSYELIERVSKGPRVEFFARIARPGWNVWGNQAPEARTA